jgi:alpha-ketoglutarate-dependent taurine dioxygenase
MAEREKPGIRPPTQARRKSVRVSSPGLVKAHPLGPDESLPLVVEPAAGGVDLAEWAANNAEFVEHHLSKHGAILFRNFGVRTVGAFEQFIRATSGELLEYADQTSPRHKVSDHIYTSTDYPADQSIFLHNESSYAAVWPLRIFFFCVVPAERGGETPIADVRKVLARIPQPVRDGFERKGWRLVRNFGGGLGLPWPTAFQTDDREAVAEYCRSAGIELAWRGGDRLRTSHVRRAIVNHPRTGEPVWFNHAAFFHASTLEEGVREKLLAQFSEDDLPYQTFYGDGSPIEAPALEAIREAYRRETVAFAWQAGDILMLDNMLVAHGRNPFTGPRRIIVGMAQPFKFERP